jgi:uncharacterized protein (TIGR02996 family)
VCEHRHFIRAVLEHPEDDGPRLVFADWLDERGDPRGAFIRIQCELERLPEADPNRRVLGERAEELRALHEAEWFGRWLKQVKPTWRRGFVHAVACRPTVWLSRAADLLTEHPVREATLTDWGPIPIDRERALSRRLARHAPTGQLHRLQLAEFYLNSDDARIYIKGGALAGLREFEVNDGTSLGLDALRGGWPTVRVTTTVPPPAPPEEDAESVGQSAS